MAMTYEQAIAALSDPQYQTIDGLRFLVSQISVQVPNAVNGAVTLLYSGTVGGDIPAWQIAEQLAGQINSPSGSQVITIGDTPVADFLKSDAFMAALHHLTGDEGFNAAYDGTINPDGTRTPGMWDIASKNLAEAATGDVRTIVPFAESGKVFAATELPALLNNPNVTHIDGIPKDYYQRMMDFILELPEAYDTVVGEQGSTLSGGQRQRIAIARALMANPCILIFDEATSALDYESERIIQHNMKAICQDRTVIIIAHRLSAVRDAHRIVVMDKGRIVEQGSHSELLRQPEGHYAYLHRLQAG
jgi:hypothetical protein